ncbi:MULTISPECIES: dTMP kinase [Caproicibacterium]|jgi:dTMP kinase|uniref:Thymidylate kinase n=1 Tax=Caproicibacterium lactatifermentans TaxID=2666138 RepID=A0A859DRR4_9FIRM|nr:thymidylate kinase [Caproicibacterium lactatifermentans]ARP49925.1 thymidylate kinase [Ruminococcaceae bacterium CPB6]MDD4807739.1 thymidylate kinase [Oscillospiraceae bacterium]QKN24354.1 thymidylate kinase [Caproicibacterium lactatifermentans]QKO30633.1 thymidylate kinase [Caproicibacterium lactatifermentans]
MGKLLVLEGLDGSGKQTQTALLDRAFSEAGAPSRRVSFPDYNQPSSALVKMYLHGEFGTQPQDVNPYAASSFYAVDRFASYRKFWKQDYDNGKCILADRYTTSNLVYQLPKLPRNEWDAFTQWLLDYEYHRLELPIPDLTLFLDMPETVSEELLEKRYHGDEGQKDIHEKDTAFQHDCRAAALYAANVLHWKVIPCSSGGAVRTPEQIAEQIRQTVQKAGLL